MGGVPEWGGVQNGCSVSTHACFERMVTLCVWGERAEGEVSSRRSTSTALALIPGWSQPALASLVEARTSRLSA